MEAGHAEELRKETYTMALYVSITLLAALTATSERASDGHVDVLALVWGTTVGLALAHWFAFRLSSLFVAGGRFVRRDVEIGLAQLLGAAAVAVLGTIPVLVLPSTAERDGDRIVLALFVGLLAYLTGRSAGGSRLRAVISSVVAMILALAVAVTKNVLSGH